MKGTVLGYIKVKSSFWFGNVRFVKDGPADGELIPCSIGDTTLRVYITSPAWVYAPLESIDFTHYDVPADPGGKIK